jgi:hypothetical protein
MKHIIKAATLFSLITLLAAPGRAQTTPSMESISYALGILFAKNLQDQGLNEISTDDMAKGLAEQMAASASMTPEQANAMVGEFFQAKKEAAGAAAKAESEAFLAENAENKANCSINRDRALPRNAHRRHRIRFVLQARRTHLLPLGQRHQRMDRRAATHEARWKDQVLHPTRIGVRREPQPERPHPTVCGLDLRSGIDLLPVIKLSCMMKNLGSAGVFSCPAGAEIH